MYIKLNPETGNPEDYAEKLTCEQFRDKSWTHSWNWDTFEQVCALASYLKNVTGKNYVAVDRTESVSPRFDVVEVPSIGDKVSYSFNGDTYPDGVIVRITRNLTVVTSTGHRYRRYKQTSGWRREGGTWWLVRGHIYEQNPHI